MEPRFTDVLESVESLGTDEKEMLIDIVRSRIVEERRAQLGSEIESSRREFQNGNCKTLTPDEIMNEVLS